MTSVSGKQTSHINSNMDEINHKKKVATIYITQSLPNIWAWKVAICSLSLSLSLSLNERQKLALFHYFYTQFSWVSAEITRALLTERVLNKTIIKQSKMIHFLEKSGDPGSETPMEVC